MSQIVDRFIAKYGRLPTEVDPAYLEMLRMSKYRIVPVPDVQPGKCSNCGASKNDGRNYIDFGLHVDWYGAVFICGECLQDIANEMGLFKELQKELEAARQQCINLSTLQEQGEKLHETVIKTVKDLEAFYAGIFVTGDDPTPDTSSVLELDPPAGESGTTETKSRATKSTPGSRRENVRSLADLLSVPTEP